LVIYNIGENLQNNQLVRGEGEEKRRRRGERRGRYLIGIISSKGGLPN
jgi:hypothetical protein